MQRPVSAPTMLSKRKTGRPILDLEDTALLSGQVGDLFKFTNGNSEQIVPLVITGQDGITNPKLHCGNFGFWICYMACWGPQLCV